MSIIGSEYMFDIILIISAPPHTPTHTGGQVLGSAIHTWYV